MPGRSDLPRSFDSVRTRLDEPGTAYRDCSWNPMGVPLNPVVESGVVHGPTPAEVWNDESLTADPSMITLTPGSQFVSGGCNRAEVWREGGDSRMLPGMAEYLSTLDPVFLEQVQGDMSNGIDCLRYLFPDFIEEKRPSDPAAASARRHRELGVHHNSRKMTMRPCTRVSCPDVPCVCFVCHTMAATVKMLRTGAAGCLGLLADVQARGEMPDVISPMTIEPKKPRVCCNCFEVNENTFDCPMKLEGLDATRTYVLGEETLMAVVDEHSGYHNHRISASSYGFFGWVFLGYVFQFQVLCFGWKPGAEIHQTRGMILTGYLRSKGMRLSQCVPVLRWECLVTLPPCCIHSTHCPLIVAAQIHRRSNTCRVKHKAG